MQIDMWDRGRRQSKFVHGSLVPCLHHRRLIIYSVTYTSVTSGLWSPLLGSALVQDKPSNAFVNNTHRMRNRKAPAMYVTGADQDINQFRRNYSLSFVKHFFQCLKIIYFRTCAVISKHKLLEYLLCCRKLYIWILLVILSAVHFLF